MFLNIFVMVESKPHKVFFKELSCVSIIKHIQVNLKVLGSNPTRAVGGDAMCAFTLRINTDLWKSNEFLFYSGNLNSLITIKVSTFLE